MDNPTHFAFVNISRNRYGDPMDLDGPSFNAGRRRNFDEFSHGEEVQVDRDHRPLHRAQMPRRVNRWALPEEPPAPQPLTWTQVLVQAVAVTTVVIAVLSLHTCRTIVQRATRVGRDAYANRDQIRQTCTVVVQSSCNAAKRRLVTVTARLPSFRRRIPPTSPRNRMNSQGDLSIREQFVAQTGTDGLVALPGAMDAESESESASESEPNSPYMMTGALPTSSEQRPHDSQDDSNSDLDSDSSMDTDYDVNDIDEIDGYESDGSDGIAHNVESNISISSSAVDDEDDTMLDRLSNKSEDDQIYGGLPSYSFAKPLQQNPLFEELNKIHGINPESICDTTESSSNSKTNQSPDSSMQKAVGLPSSLRFSATPMRTGAQKNPSSSPTTPHQSTPTRPPKKSVAFFESPTTGRPVAGTKKFIMGEAIDFPVGSSSVLEESTLSSVANSVVPDDSLIDHEQATKADLSLKHPSIDSGVDLCHVVEPEHEYSGLLQASSPTLSKTTGKEDVGTPIDCNISLVPASLESLPTVEGDILPVDDADTVSHEEVSVVVAAGSQEAEPDRLAESVEVAAVERSTQAAGRQVQDSSDSNGNNLNLTSSVSSGRTGRPSSRRSQSPRRSSRRNRRSPGTTQRLTDSLQSLDLASRRGSVRMSERLDKKKKAHEEQVAAEAAKKLREEAEAAEAASKAKEAEEAEEAARKEREAEEERRKQSVRRVPKEKIIQPLDATWEANVQQALDAPNMRQVVVTLSSGVTLTRKDIGTLKVVPGRDPAHGWLNDEIIAACLQQVVDYGLSKSDHKAGETPKYHAFNTFFYKNLRDKGTQSVKRWATRAKIGKEDLLKVERVFIPVHQGAHWTLLVISPLARTIEYFDSLGGRADSYVQNAKLWLAEELGRGWKEDEWTVPTGSYGAGPRQANSSDCGVFTCTTARMVVLGVDPMSYGGDDMGVQRARMVAELLNGGLVGEFEPRVVF